MRPPALQPPRTQWEAQSRRGHWDLKTIRSRGRGRGCGQGVTAASIPGHWACGQIGEGAVATARNFKSKPCPGHPSPQILGEDSCP